jgi:hypothetical protein
VPERFRQFAAAKLARGGAVRRDYYGYCTTPIDHGWQHMPTVIGLIAQYARKVADDDATIEAKAEAASLLNDLADLMTAAVRLGFYLEWDGDTQFGMRAFMVASPNDCAFVSAVAWKQSNNGTCFIVSPVPL